MQIDFKKPKKIYANQELHHRLSGQVASQELLIGALMYGFILNSIEVHWTIFSATILIMLISVLFLISLSKAHDI